MFISEAARITRMAISERLAMSRDWMGMGLCGCGSGTRGARTNRCPGIETRTLDEISKDVKVP